MKPRHIILGILALSALSSLAFAGDESISYPDYQKNITDASAHFFTSKKCDFSVTNADGKTTTTLTDGKETVSIAVGGTDSIVGDYQTSGGNSFEHYYKIANVGSVLLFQEPMGPVSGASITNDKTNKTITCAP